MIKLLIFLSIIASSGCASLRHPDSVGFSENVDKDFRHAGNQFFFNWAWKDKESK